MTHLHCASMIFRSSLWKFDDGFQRRTVKSSVKACLKPQEGNRKQKYDKWFPEKNRAEHCQEEQKTSGSSKYKSVSSEIG